MVQHRLQPLLCPRSIAVVGASPRPGTFGHSCWQAVLETGFDGDLFLVNPRYDEIEGRPCWPDLASLPRPVEHAALIVANARLESVFDATVAAGIPAATIFASGYLEDDGDPPLLQRLKAKARQAGLLVCGGNGSGFVNRAEKVQVALAGRRASMETGPVALISQSGSVYLGLVQTDGRLGFNLTVSSGQEISVTAADYMDYALELESTRAIALFLETIRDPQAFRAAAEKALARGVPVVAVKAARTEESARMAVSHSGALAGDDAAHDAFFERYAVLRTDDIAEMIATLQLAIQPRPFVPGGLVAMTDSGGEREHLVDLAEARGVPFARISPQTKAKLASRLEYGLEPANPLDAWGTGKDYVAIFSDCWQALMADPAAAMGLWVADMRDREPYRKHFIEGASAVCRRTGKPMAFATCVPGGIVHETARRLYALGIPFIDGLGPAVAAVAHAMAWCDWRAAPAMVPPPGPDGAIVARWRRRLAAGGPLGEGDGLALARDFGLPTVETVAVASEEEAVQAVARLGGKVVLKTAMPGLAHKSDVGGVVLGLEGGEAVAAAFRALAASLGPRCLLQPLAPAGAEMVFGLVKDAQFGPLVLVGTGGIFVEALRDTALAVPPFDARFARRLIDRLRARPLLDGARGRAAADIDALALALARFSVLAACLGDILAEFELNPVLAGAQGPLAVDALLRPQTEEEKP